MKFDLRPLATRLLAFGKTRVRSIQTALAEGTQAAFRSVRLGLSLVTKLSPRSVLLQLLALSATALMTVLAISGLQTIARETEAEQAANHRPTHRPAAVQQPASNAQPWTKLPNGLAKSPAPAPKSQPSPGTNPVKSPGQKSDPKAASQSAAKGSAAKGSAAKGSTAQATPPAKATQPQVAQAKPAQPKPAQTKPASPAPQPTSPVPATVLLPSSLNTLAPPQQAAPADPTNYGERYAQDIFGKPVQNEPLIVLHETVGSADSAINTVQTPHPNERDQSSYHSIIRLDGTIVYVVPPEKRAYGAGNSVFQSFKGAETVRTHPSFPPSVNNFAYHISLETPPDGHNTAETHSGYTDAQYRSLAWLVAHTSVSDDRVTTHRAIDQSGSRIDPRSFDASRFYGYLRTLPRPYLEVAPG